MNKKKINLDLFNYFKKFNIIKLFVMLSSRRSKVSNADSSAG
jgi:hypothetical protein